MGAAVQDGILAAEYADPGRYGTDTSYNRKREYSAARIRTNVRKRLINPRKYVKIKQEHMFLLFSIETIGKD